MAGVDRLDIVYRSICDCSECIVERRVSFGDGGFALLL